MVGTAEVGRGGDYVRKVVVGTLGVGGDLGILAVGAVLIGADIFVVCSVVLLETGPFGQILVLGGRLAWFLRGSCGWLLPDRVRWWRRELMELRED